ncbi:MAG: calcium-binding protein [Phycisphaerae bacterium]|nr:calcium-binding protein [Phycisphaerae bacterium]
MAKWSVMQSRDLETGPFVGGRNHSSSSCGPPRFPLLARLGYFVCGHVLRIERFDWRSVIMTGSRKTERHERNLCLLLTVGMLFGTALVWGVIGCQTSGPSSGGCNSDENCDDGLFCNGAETCNTETRQCVAGTPPCDAALCVEEDDTCMECLEDSDCADDDLFCTGDPVCSESGTCGFGDDPCEEGETCNEDADRCEIVQTEVDFTADNPGVDFDALVAGEPVELTAPLPEGDFSASMVQCDFVGWQVNGGGSFDPVSERVTSYTPASDDTELVSIWECNGVFYSVRMGITVGESARCEIDEDCGPVQDCLGGWCVPIACTADETCDDGLFCTGNETCGEDGYCAAGTRPCDDEGDDATEVCQEGESMAECIPIEDITMYFTLAVDNLIGTADADRFVANQEMVPATGQLLPTLQTGDMADGGAGDDILHASYGNNTGGPLTITATLANIEALTFTDLGGNAATTISATNFTGVVLINTQESVANASITNVSELADLGVLASDSDLSVTYVSPATDGAADAITLTLNGATDSDTDTDGGGADTDTAGCTVNITTPANGLETLNIESAGTQPNALERIIQTTGTTLKTLNVTGSQDLRVARLGGGSAVASDPLPATLDTISLSAFTGDSDLTVTGALNVVYIGGAGDDVINFAGTYTSGDTINGGAGVNTLGVNSAQAVAAVTNQTNVTNATNLLIPDSLNGTIAAYCFGATTVVLDTTVGATPLTAGASTINFSLGSSPVVTLHNDDTAHTLDLTVSGVGTADELTLNLFNADLGDALTAIDAETLTIVSGNGADGTAADGGANTATAITLLPTIGAGELDVTGDVPFNVSGVITAGTINASGLGAAFSMGAAPVGWGVAITGSAFNDTLLGSSNGDSIRGGAGNDTITGGGGQDLLTGEDGADTFALDQAGSRANLLESRNTIADFTPTADRFFVNNAGGVAHVGVLTGSDAFASASAIQEHTTSGNLTVNASARLVRITVENVTTFSTDGAAVVDALVSGAGTGTITAPANASVLFSVYDGTNTAIYLGAADTTGGGNTVILQSEIVLVATLNGVNHTALTYANFLP